MSKTVKLKRKKGKKFLPSGDLHSLLQNSLLDSLSFSNTSVISRNVVSDILETASYNPVLASLVLLKEIDIYQYGNTKYGIAALEEEASKVSLLGLKASVLQSLLKLYYIESGKDESSVDTLDIVLTYDNFSLENKNEDKVA